MSSYDIYIWPSYLIAAAVLVGLAVISWRTKKKDMEQLRNLEQKMQDFSDR